jgi:hypothetical protein
MAGSVSCAILYSGTKRDPRPPLSGSGTKMKSVNKSSRSPQRRVILYRLPPPSGFSPELRRTCRRNNKIPSRSLRASVQILLLPFLHAAGDQPSPLGSGMASIRPPLCRSLFSLEGGRPRPPGRIPGASQGLRRLGTSALQGETHPGLFGWRASSTAVAHPRRILVTSAAGDSMGP